MASLTWLEMKLAKAVAKESGAITTRVTALSSNQ